MFAKLFTKKEGGKKEEGGGKPFAGDVEALWFLEGKAYDLSKFTKMHPGKEADKTSDTRPSSLFYPTHPPTSQADKTNTNPPTHPTHPPSYTGGAEVLLELQGKDGTAALHEAHGTNHSSAPYKKLGRMEVKGLSEEVLAAKFGKGEEKAKSESEAP